MYEKNKGDTISSFYSGSLWVDNKFFATIYKVLKVCALVVGH